MKNKYIWITDTHITTLFDRRKVLKIILDENPKGVFHTGDISQSGLTTLTDLEYIGKHITCPFYFNLGNHNIWFSSFEKIHKGVKDLCKQYKNLIWMENESVVSLNDETCVCGVEGWYDARVGDPQYLTYTLDWMFIEELRNLPTMKHRVEMFQDMAKQSAKKAVAKLEKAIENHKTVFLLTHYPTVREANRTDGWLPEKFWEPYNCNLILGEELEKVMEKHRKRNLTILSGHIHTPSTTINRNIECRVGRGSYYKISEDETIYI
jgi:predicted phosphohydrolase